MRGSIVRRTVNQAYDEQAGMFLPDRFVRGTCPRCRTADQYGDSLRELRRHLHAADLKDPVSTSRARARSGAIPSTCSSPRPLRAHAARMARQRLAAGAVRAKLDEWFEAGCRTGTSPATRRTSASRCRTRRASISTSGSMRRSATSAASRAGCQTHGLDFDAYWKPDSQAELYHFIGKDISYFHTLFWPAVLHGAGYRRPPPCSCMAS
jgi:methionyl-tRNA synthetase